MDNPAMQSKMNNATQAAENAADMEKTLEREQAMELFLSGCAMLSLKDYAQASENFFQACKLSPAEPRNWIYLLASLTDAFRVLHPIADEKATRNAGKAKIKCVNVYKNVVATAKKDDYINAKSEFDIDLDPCGAELWESILYEICRGEKLPVPTQRAADIALVCAQNLQRSHPENIKRYLPHLCRKLNPVKEGVLEVNTLAFYPESENGILALDTNADSIEFVSDDMAGKERYSAFLLTKSVVNIGTQFPFSTLVCAADVAEIPEKFMCFCGGIERVVLSPAVRKIGKNAFTGCVNLRSLSSIENVEYIGDQAFYGTGIRMLDIPQGIKAVGREILGVKKSLSAERDISRYLIKIDEETASKSPDFNTVGEHKCGYLLRSNGKLRLIYPIKSVDGKTKALTQDEKMIFKALAYASIGDEDLKRDPITAVKDFFVDTLPRFLKKS